MSRFELAERLNSASCISCLDDVQLQAQFDQERLDTQRSDLGVFIEDIATTQDATYQ